MLRSGDAGSVPMGFGTEFPPIPIASSQGIATNVRDVGERTIMADTEPKAAVPPADKRLHKATFARDKRNPGGYLIRVEGPTAAAFAGRMVPVTRQDGTESMETLTVAVWAGIDEGTPARDGRPARPATGKPVALYHFEARQRDEAADDLPF